MYIKITPLLDEGDDYVSLDRILAITPSNNELTNLIRKSEYAANETRNKVPDNFSIITTDDIDYPTIYAREKFTIIRDELIKLGKLDRLDLDSNGINGSLNKDNFIEVDIIPVIDKSSIFNSAIINKRNIIRISSLFKFSTEFCKKEKPELYDRLNLSGAHITLSTGKIFYTHTNFSDICALVDIKNLISKS